MKKVDLKHGHFYWIRLGDEITVGQYDTTHRRPKFDFIGSEQFLYLGLDEFDVLEEIPSPTFFVPGSNVALYGENHE